VVLVREVLVAGAAVVLALAGARRIDVQWAGKAGTFGLMVTIPLFLVANSTASWKDAAHVAAWIAAVPAVAFSWYAAITYVPMARQALAEGRAGRAGRAGRGGRTGRTGDSGGVAVTRP
jgi:cardiolipin synthase